MTTEVFQGTAVVLASGVLNGSFVVPMKDIRRWQWENIWLVYSVIGLLVLPWALAAITVPHLLQVLHATSWRDLLTVLGFGAGWGIGSVLFGLGVSRMGLAVGYGLILGVNAPLGSWFPLLVLHRDAILTAQGYALMIGTVLVVAGILFCALAARIRERGNAVGLSSSVSVGILICILSGIFSPMLNFSFIFGAKLQQHALQAGATSTMATNAIWAIALTSGAIVNIGYTVILLCRNRTWSLYRGQPANASTWFRSALMGLICFASFVAYGVGANTLGTLGGILGWPLFLSMSLITSNILGVLKGEWAGVPRRASLLSAAGIAVLIVAIVIISRGGVS
jgi:L-rhamnose-H+ transport protein